MYIRIQTMQGARIAFCRNNDGFESGILFIKETND